MKRILFIVVFLINSSIGRGQTYLLANKQSKINNYIQQETGLGSTYLLNTAEYMVVGFYDVAQPIRYKRKFYQFSPSPVISFYFSFPDSIVRMIQIEMDSSSFLKEKENYFETNNRLPVFNEEYDKLLKEMIKQFGSSETIEKLNKKPDFQKDFYWSRRDYWDNDAVKCDLELVFSEQIKKNGTYRIRATIEYK